MSKVACALHINFEPGCWECDDANPSTEAEPERICGRAEASCHADRDAMTSELAEARRLADEWCRAWAELPSPEATDELRRELAEARRQLGEVTTKLELLEHEHRGALSDLKWCIPLAEDMASEDDDDFEEWQEIKERWLEGWAFGAGEAK